MAKELEIKIARLRNLMDEKGLDGIYIKGQDNFAWLTCGGRNYVGMGSVGNCGLLVTKNGLFAITNNIEAPRMRDEEKLETLGFKILYGVWHDSSFEKKTISELVPSGKVGYDTSDLAKNIQLLRFSLTAEEIERYQEIGKDASIAMEEAAINISAGMSEYEIAGDIMSRMEAKGLEILSCMVAADERISLYRHPLPTSKKVEKRVQIGGNFRRNGLVICLTRYVWFYEPTEEEKKQYYDNQVIDCTYMAASKPGNTFVSALEKGRSKYTELGYEGEFDKHHQGGPIGYQGRDYRVGFDTPGVIAENQAFCWNPSITGTKSEDTVISTKDGIIPVTRPVLFPENEIVVDDQTFIRPGILVRK
ncbi:M24 family metallopeptidase [Bullifex sp.]|uniref:M24 family metallopeptidase n=1 Tax=Bullifex sp. TaxID=2815808 RepID=UPI002A7F5DA7|nr:M24 family metallopeptidase [Bullifex sp.]MDY4066523.1 aminopeptidase P family N-terminal domain-containing protein [Bullifex sp.]